VRVVVLDRAQRGDPVEEIIEAAGVHHDVDDRGRGRLVVGAQLRGQRLQILGIGPTQPGDSGVGGRQLGLDVSQQSLLDRDAALNRFQTRLQ